MYFFWILAGLAAGSFSNMLAYRLPRRLPIVFSRSKCERCASVLSVLELIPLVSFVLQKGRCAHCGKPIGWRHFVCEAASAAIWPVCWAMYGYGLMFFKTALFLQVMVVLFFADWETYTLPDELIMPVTAAGFLSAFFGRNLLDVVLGFCVGFGVYFAVAKTAAWYYKKEALGLGDVKLGGAIGAYWGFKTAALTCYFSFIFGGVAALILVLAKIKKRGDYLPFGPAIILASVFALFWGDWLWRLYAG
jgi:leader peptidase (prepilin peptidase)/N-methyltransferase